LGLRQEALVEKTPDQVYTDLLRQLASPIGTEPEVLADMFREVERMHSAGQIEDWQLHNAREAYAKTTGSRIGDAAARVMDEAKEALQVGLDHVGERARTSVATYTRKDPVKAVLISAGVGALVMSIVARVARSGVRTVKRKVRW
jgi:ElaB/YqjD/DUF883 family membrane-anchored ribosome-binding protein